MLLLVLLPTNPFISVVFVNATAVVVVVVVVVGLQLPNEWQFSDTNAKAHVLLQSHFSRTALSTDLRQDQKVGGAVRCGALGAAFSAQLPPTQIQIR